MNQNPQPPRNAWQDRSQASVQTKKVYIAQRLNVFLASLKTLPHDTEVCLDDGSPAGWTYSAREGRVYIHK